MNDWLNEEEFSSMRAVSDGSAKRFGRLAPNLVTLARIPLAGLVAAAVLDGQYALVFVAGGIAYLTDFLDGALARYQARAFGYELLPHKKELALGLWGRLTRPGQTHLGRLLDALLDKVLFASLVLSFGWGRISWWILGPILLLGVALTLIRPVKLRLGVPETASNKFGKLKVWAEVLALLAMDLFLFLDREEDAVRYGSIFLSLALLLALLSFLGHLRPFFRRPP